jgi:hypothetical protein
MSWWNPIDYWSGLNREIERGKELDAKIDQFNRRAVDGGAMTQQEYNDFVARNEWATGYQQQSDQAIWDGVNEGWDRMTAPLESAVQTGKKALTFILILQYALAGLAVWLAYKYFLAKR